MDGADLVKRLLNRRPRAAAYPTGKAGGVADGRVDFAVCQAGRAICRRMQWGDQPLPGWRIHHVAAESGTPWSLIDLRDPCQLTVATNDTGLVIVDDRRISEARCA